VRKRGCRSETSRCIENSEVPNLFVLDVIIDYCDVKIIIERCNAMDEFSRGCLGLVITLVGSRERFERIGSEERPKIHR
jgi:hypothetical protein